MILPKSCAILSNILHYIIKLSPDVMIILYFVIETLCGIIKSTHKDKHRQATIHLDTQAQKEEEREKERERERERKRKRERERERDLQTLVFE